MTTASTAERLDNAGDVVEYLIGQHMQIRNLFAEVMTAPADRRREPFGRLVRMLSVHETAEEQLVHPLVRAGVAGGDEIVQDRLREEREAKELLAELENLAPDAPDFMAQLNLLRLSVLAHAHHEESYEFRYLRQEVDASKTGSLLQLVKAAEAVAPTHPHPGVESATANTLAGPVVSLFDRTKDLVRNALAGDSGERDETPGDKDEPPFQR